MRTNKLRYVALIAVACLSCGLAACGKNVKGTYKDAASAFTLDLKSGGEASITVMDQVTPCTYTVSGDKLALKCQGQAGNAVFTIQDNGSLTPPPDALLPTLQKVK